MRRLLAAALCLCPPLRRQFARALREQILEIVSSVDEVDDEIRYLLGILAQAPPVT